MNHLFKLLLGHLSPRSASPSTFGFAGPVAPCHTRLLPQRGCLSQTSNHIDPLSHSFLSASQVPFAKESVSFPHMLCKNFIPSTGSHTDTRRHQCGVDSSDMNGPRSPWLAAAVTRLLNSTSSSLGEHHEILPWGEAFPRKKTGTQHWNAPQHWGNMHSELACKQSPLPVSCSKTNDLSMAENFKVQFLDWIPTSKHNKWHQHFKSKASRRRAAPGDASSPLAPVSASRLSPFRSARRAWDWSISEAVDVELLQQTVAC